MQNHETFGLVLIMANIGTTSGLLSIKIDKLSSTYYARKGRKQIHET